MGSEYIKIERKIQTPQIIRFYRRKNSTKLEGKKIEQEYSKKPISQKKLLRLSKDVVAGVSDT